MTVTVVPSGYLISTITGGRRTIVTSFGRWDGEDRQPRVHCGAVGVCGAVGGNKSPCAATGGPFGESSSPEVGHCGPNLVVVEGLSPLMSAHGSRPERRDDRLSLAPLSPEEALRALLAVKPDDEPVAEDANREPDTGAPSPSHAPD